MLQRSIALFLQLLGLTWFQTVPPAQMQVGPTYSNGILVTSNQLLRPAGTRIEFSGGPTDLAISPDGATVAVTVGSAVNLYSGTGILQRTLQLSAAVTYSGAAFSPDGKTLAVSVRSGVALFTLATGSARMIAVPDPIPCGLAFDPIRPFLYVAFNTRNQVARIDLNQQQVAGTIAVGVAPLGLAVTPGGKRLFVSNWGGRPPSAGEPSASSGGTAVLVDASGLPVSGTVSAVDLSSFLVIGNVLVGLHPSGIQSSPAGDLIAVANANSDTISWIDPNGLTVVATTPLAAFPEGYVGSSPTALAFTADGSHLYVTCAGNNSLVSLLRRSGSYQIDGSAPTDWYPIAVGVISANGADVVFVANAKGVGSRDGQSPYGAKQRLGTVGRVEAGGFRDGRAVSRLNDIFDDVPLAARKIGPRPSPARPHQLDLAGLGVRHVFLIIKENRTYDQVLGDLGKGNGSPSLTLYGANVTPNHHQLASQFVTLDNFYATGVVSPEGHQWITQAMTSDYMERSYTAGWTRSYPFTGNDPLAFAPSGFIWDNVLRKGLSVRIFGEFTVAANSYQYSWTQYLADAREPQMQYSTLSRSPVASAQPVIEPSYPGFALNVPDQFRARIFLDKFRGYVRNGDLPNLVILWLPSDHTAGLSPGSPTPQAMMADNDLAVGQIVEAISGSSYWTSSAIFVVEDDAQDGVDHVDGHRTICLVASPFTRRGAVDSTSYNQTSVVRTIEDLLGLSPMNKFDAAALPMRSVFDDIPDMSSYYAVPNSVSLSQFNPSAQALRGAERKAALASMKMNFSIPDAAPEDVLNRILWHAAQGWRRPYPRVPHDPKCKPTERDN